MKHVLTVLFCLLLFLPIARADGPDDQYVAIYSLIQKGDTLSEKGQVASSIARYREAESALKLFKTNYPDWNVKVVEFRLKYLETKISDLSSQPASPPPAAATTMAAAPMAVTPGETAPATPATNSPPEMSSHAPPAATMTTPAPEPPPAPNPAPAPTPAAGDSERQMAQLQARIDGLEADRSLLQAKLKEALAAQPAPIDPRELAKAQEQVKELQRENGLLNASLAQAKTNAAPVGAGIPSPAQMELASVKEKLSQLTAANAGLVSENQALQTRLKAIPAPDQDAPALRQENALLKKQLGELQARAAAGPAADATGQKLKEAQAQLAALQSDQEILRLQNIALEERLKKLSAASATAAPVSAPAAAAPTSTDTTPLLDSVTAARIAKLEAQRDELQKSVDAATRDIQGNKKGKETSARIDEMSRELAGFRAQIEVLEAKPVPFSPTELTLLNQTNPTLMAVAHTRKSAKELPAGAGILQAEAQRYFAAHELDKAEAKYLELLKLDEKNVVTLGDLGYLELEMGRLPEAEKYLHSALAAAPDDDYSLFLLGKLRFLQKNYDEALDASSRAAQINPQSPETENLLGVILSEKGLRGPAETAFRKAIQLNPGYADAHFNLAVVYVTQQPPLVKLARWHYQKALAAGHAANPDLEKFMNAGASGAASAH